MSTNVSKFYIDKSNMNHREKFYLFHVIIDQNFEGYNFLIIELLSPFLRESLRFYLYMK